MSDQIDPKPEIEPSIEIMKSIGMIVGAAGLMILAVALWLVPFWFIWNSVVTVVFGAKEITIVQAFALLVLAHSLFPSGGKKD